MTQEVVHTISNGEEHNRTRFAASELAENKDDDPALWALACRFTQNDREDPLAYLSEFRDCVGWIDVKPSNPLNYEFRGITGPTKAFGLELSGKPIFEFPSRIHSTNLILDVSQVKRESVVLYDHIDQTIHGIRRTYKRLLAPFKDKHGRTTKVYYAVRWITPHVPAKLRLVQ